MRAFWCCSLGCQPADGTWKQWAVNKLLLSHDFLCILTFIAIYCHVRGRDVIPSILTLLGFGGAISKHWHCAHKVVVVVVRSVWPEGSPGERSSRKMSHTFTGQTLWRGYVQVPYQPMDLCHLPLSFSKSVCSSPHREPGTDPVFAPLNHRLRPSSSKICSWLFPPYPQGGVPGALGDPRYS